MADEARTLIASASNDDRATSAPGLPKRRGADPLRLVSHSAARGATTRADTGSIMRSAGLPDETTLTLNRGPVSSWAASINASTMEVEFKQMKLYSHEHADDERRVIMLLLDQSDVFERLATQQGWKLPSPLPRFLRVTFEHGAAEVDSLVGSYLVHIGLAHMTPQRSTVPVWHTNRAAYMDSRRHVATMPAATVDRRPRQRTVGCYQAANRRFFASISCSGRPR
jgi:hypothetical protein